MSTIERLNESLCAVRARTDFVPKVALVLGSGLGDFGRAIRLEASVEYKDIPGFPVSTVLGHEGRFLFGWVEDVPVVCMQGRVHYYEGYSMEEVVMPIRLMGMLGAEILFLTNAAGGVNTAFGKGALMIIKDHISALVPSPLRGPNVEELGTRFPDMSEVYDAGLQQTIRSVGKRLGIPLEEGIYLQTAGPNYETPQEIRTYKLWGADAVGMSTACEAMAARHMGLRVCGISCITNMAAGISAGPLSHAEVKETADRVAVEFRELVWNAISAMK